MAVNHVRPLEDLTYMSAHVLLDLLNELGKKIRCEDLPSILSIFFNVMNKFNNTGALMQDSILRMTLKSLILLAYFALKRHNFTIRTCNVFMDVKA